MMDPRCRQRDQLTEVRSADRSVRIFTLRDVYLRTFRSPASRTVIREQNGHQRALDDLKAKFVRSNNGRGSASVAGDDPGRAALGSRCDAYDSGVAQSGGWPQVRIRWPESNRFLKAEPGIAVVGIGRGLRALHDALPVELCPLLGSVRNARRRLFDSDSVTNQASTAGWCAMEMRAPRTPCSTPMDDSLPTLI